MSMGGSSESVSTAQAGQATKPNKMKLDMPPRPPKTNIAGGATSAAAANNTKGSMNNNSTAESSVPHVVRVTFLGVAGLLVKPPHLLDDETDQATAIDEKDQQPTQKGSLMHKTPSQQPQNEEETIPSSEIIKTTSPAVGHPSLLLPLPPNLRVVASVSRSRTARGIPSGMSKCLSQSSKNKKEPPNPLSPTSSLAPCAGSFALSPVAGESIVFEKQSSQQQKQQQSSSSSVPTIIEGDMISTGGISNSSQELNVISSAKKESKGNSGTTFGTSPPSQIMHSRTSSSSRRPGSRLSGASIGSGGEAESSRTGGNFKEKSKSHTPTDDEDIDGIEVIRPVSPTMGGSGNNEKVEEPPERFVAVWDEAANKKTMNPNKRYVNLTNSLAFEAELRPSSSVADGRAATPAASTTFAPKSFCIAVGLVPDFDPMSGDGENNPPAGTGEEKATPKKSDDRTPPLPTFAIPVGFADLVINGDETLDGKRKQIDLPLSSLGNFMGLEKGNSYPFPLIELTAEGLGATGNNSDDTKKDAADTKNGASKAVTASGKAKKKSIVKRMFSRKQQQQSSSSVAMGEDATSLSPYDGTPKSIYQLERPPNAKERALFLDRYGVDPSGDAVVRIALEVFPRGSELEKVFRQKNKLRKKAQAAALASAARRKRMKGRPASPSSASAGSHSDCSHSLMDDEDSDYDDSVFSQSFFTLDSDESRTTWDESTMYTDALSSFNTMRDDESFTTELTDYKKPKASKGTEKSVGSFLTSLLNCTGSGPTTCGNVEDDEMDTSTQIQPGAPYPNIDMVASALDSMSVSDSVTAPVTTKEDKQAESPSSQNDIIMTAHSVASMDTERQRTKNNRGGTSESSKDGGKELNIDTSIPMQTRTHTVKEEVSPLATIKQRVANDDIDNLVEDERKQQIDEIGEELTLEDHPSASV